MVVLEGRDAGSKRRLKQFLHAEERFSDVGQTVAVWALGDWGRSRHSDECFQQRERQRRQESSSKRREKHT